MTRRFWVGLALALPVVVLEMGGHLAGLHRLIPPQVSGWLQLVLATPVVLWAGWPFFVRGWASVVARSLNMFTLDRHGDRRRLGLQRRRDVRPRPLPGRVSRHGRSGGGLFRSGGGDHRAGPARSSPGTSGPRADGWRHPRAARPRAEDHAARERGQRGSGGGTGRGRRGRPAPRAAGRQGAGGRRNRRRQEQRGRVDGDRGSPCPSPRRRETR